MRTDLIRRYGRGLSARPGSTDHTPDAPAGTPRTFLGALRVTGLTAPAVSSMAPIDWRQFSGLLSSRSSMPTLASRRHRHHADNLSRVTKSPAVRQSDRSASARTLWFLPKYSPDFNPIELAFAKLKAILRKARCRTREVLWHTIGAAVPGYDPAECATTFDIAAIRSLRPHEISSSKASPRTGRAPLAAAPPAPGRRQGRRRCGSRLWHRHQSQHNVLYVTFSRRSAFGFHRV